MKEQIKYDFSKCNNLSFKIKKHGGIKEGFLKVDKDKIYVYFNDETIFSTAFEIEFKKCDRMLPIASFNEWAEENELEIIPRDSETYNDWKVGDVIKCKNSDTKRIIISRIGEIIFISDLFENYIQEISTTKSIAQNYKLVLTDYEQELLNKQEQKKCQFKRGDKVLVRDYNSSEWRFAIFEFYDEDNEYPYRVESLLSFSYRQCIPFTECTWKLLGTTDEYKEK